MDMFSTFFGGLMCNEKRSNSTGKFDYAVEQGSYQANLRKGEGSECSEDPSLVDKGLRVIAESDSNSSNSVAAPRRGSILRAPTSRWVGESFIPPPSPSQMQQSVAKSRKSARARANSMISIALPKDPRAPQTRGRAHSLLTGTISSTVPLKISRDSELEQKRLGIRGAKEVRTRPVPFAGERDAFLRASSGGASDQRAMVKSISGLPGQGKGIYSEAFNRAASF